MTQFRYLSHLVREIKLFEEEAFPLIKNYGGSSAPPPPGLNRVNRYF